MILKSLNESYGQIKEILSYRRYLLTAVVIGVLFFIVYAIATQMMSITERNNPFNFILASNWPNLIFKEIAFPNYEPIMRVDWGPIIMFLSVPNLVLALVITILASLNLTISIFSITAPSAKICKINPVQGILSSLPAFLTGFACCSPIFLVSLGIFTASTSVFLIQIFPFFVPLSLIGLFLSLYYSTWRLSTKIEEANQSDSVKLDKQQTISL